MRDLLHRWIPYVGTVILLPIPVTLGAFSLLFMRQFGSEYDVWAGFMPSGIFGCPNAAARAFGN